MDGNRFDRVTIACAERCRRSSAVAPHRFTRRAGLRRIGAVLVAATSTAGLARVVAQPATPVADLTGVAPLPLTGERLEAFSAYVETKMADLGVPGAAIAVVQDGAVVFLEGFGVQELGRPEPVTADTLLRIGSVTKSFSSMLVATLVDAGRLSWSTPLVDILPDFAVADPELTPRLTIADAFCACTGLPRQDFELIFNGMGLTPESLVAALPGLPLTAPYGETYQYNNQLVATGGFAAAVANSGAPDDLGRAYAIALREQVLNRIGMPRTTLSLDDVVVDGDYATGHGEDATGALIPRPLLEDFYWTDPQAPSGGLWSTAREMARYVQVQVGRGLGPDGTRVVSAENLERTWQPGIAMPVSPADPPELAASTTHYALGWASGSFGGLRMVNHSGATLGYEARATFLPDAGIGIAVLINGRGAAGWFTWAVTFRLLELLFEQPETFDADLEPILAAAAAEQSSLLAQLGPVDQAAVTSYLGRYTSPALGEVTLAWRDDRLVFDAGEFRTELQARLDAGGSVLDYRMVDPPFGGIASYLPITLERDAGDRPRLVLGLTAYDLVYPFDLVAAATG